MSAGAGRAVASRTLEGRVVVVTRPRVEEERLAAELRGRGAAVLSAPAIAIEPTDQAALAAAAQRLAAGEFAWLVLTSRAGVEALLAHAGPAAIHARVAAVGDGTAAALRARGVEPDLVPATFTTAALGEAMPAGSGRVLLARADIAPPELEGALEAKGWTPVRLVAYRTVRAGALPEEALGALRSGEADAVTFTSASTVEGFAEAMDDAGLSLAPGTVVACIGPVTAARARARGLTVGVEASPHTIDGLVAALERVLGPAGPEGARVP